MVHAPCLFEKNIKESIPRTFLPQPIPISHFILVVQASKNNNSSNWKVSTKFSSSFATIDGDYY
jgi:hypothetical protein